MSVKVKSRNKTYVLNREEFQRYMKALWQRAQEHRRARRSERIRKEVK